MNRQDLPRCKTCKWWHATSRVDVRFCDSEPSIAYLRTTRANDGCLMHSDYDEPKTQTEADDDMRR